MRPKMEGCLAAVRGGVPTAQVVDGRIPHVLLGDLDQGTTVIPDQGAPA